jgi:CRP-like cAMP-binding protein
MSIERLINNPWLAELSPESRQSLLKIVRFRHYVEHQQVHNELSVADGLYGVVSGQVRVSATTQSGEELVFAQIFPGGWFGEIALLDGGQRTHDAHATMDTEIAILPKQAVIQIYEKHPDVYRALVKLLCEHCRQAFEAINDFLLLTPAQRMAKTILTRLEVSSGNYLPVKQQELGAMIGISRQSTSKILKAWESQGLIQKSMAGWQYWKKTGFIKCS